MSIDIDFIEYEWIPTLRSGEYEQETTGYLHKGNGYCCLGVACDLFIRRGELDGWSSDFFKKHEGWITDDTYALGDEYQWLPAQLAERLGMNPQGGRTDGKTFTDGNGNCGYETLTEANDDAIPFSKIADLVENYVEELKANATTKASSPG